jgi:RNA-splicing ligase RtcB
MELKGKYTTAFLTVDNLDDSCLQQIRGFVNNMAFSNPIAIMPDAHAGKASCIGFTMPMADKVIPNVIGVDIGCGMLSYNIGTELEMPLKNLDKEIQDKIPMGMTVHKSSVVNVERQFPYERVQKLSMGFAEAYKNKFGVALSVPKFNYEYFLNKCKEIGASPFRVSDSIGTLGGG